MKLLYRPRILKGIAAFLLIEMLTQLAAPAVSYALTSGPTAPEATSFEPVDTTDMVDLSTGDFTYNIPLLEVPGPEGGYPLALSYHAGIQPNEDASWVGLGWSLNPGAINRNVNGFADDHENVVQTRRDYWVGGSTSTTSIGLTYGFPSTPASVSFDLSFSQDTYRGFGVGANAGIGANMFREGPMSMNVGASVYADTYGNSGAGVGVGISATHSSGISGNLGISASTSGGVGADVGVKLGNMMGASMNLGSSTPSLSVGGTPTTVENSKSGTIQTEASSAGIIIPVYPGITVSLKNSIVRYWSDETVDVTTNGSLYSPQAYVSNVQGSAGNFNNKAFDTYRLLDPSNSNVYENPNPNKLLGGSYSEHDNYAVSAQGLSGNMRPYRYQEGLYSQNSVSQNIVQVNDYPLPWVNKPAFFRFENDFSNQYRQSSSGILTSGPYSYQGTSFDHVRYNFDSQPYRGETNTVGYEYDFGTDRIAGSKAIEYYTNRQIIDGQAKTSGFIDQQAKGFVRDNNSQIGGFSITNASGVTYHYALPVYAFNEYVYMQKVGDSGTHNALSKANKYAYTWYLTAVTGPDYVDRNSDGLANQGDWGYWTVFNHGKWVKDYKWRNPSEGFHRDVDASFEGYSSGSKELYFLNSAATRTHTAVFVKSYRSDGKGYTPANFSIARTGGCVTNPQGITRCNWIYSYPGPQLKLDRIVVLNNQHLPTDLERRSNEYNNTQDLDFGDESTRGKTLLGENIVDASDYTATPALITNAISSCVFTYDYSLSPNTSNSWGESIAPYKVSDVNLSLTAPQQRKGKLTLNQIQTFGAEGNGAMPPTKFGYDLPESEKPKGSILISTITNSQGYVMLGQNTPFKLGDLLEFNVNGLRYCCALVKMESGVDYLARYIGRIPPQGTYVASLTKNPPYSKDMYDMWGMFKSDFNTDLSRLVGFDETMARATSAVSAQNTDAWSLRTIQTPLGGTIRINYENDDYRTVVVKRPQMIANFSRSQLVRAGPNGSGGYYYNLTLGSRLAVPASTVFHSGQKVMISAVIGYYTEFPSHEPPRGNTTTIKDKLITINQVSDVAAAGTNNIYFSDDTNALDIRYGNIQAEVYMGHLTLNDKPSVSQGGGIRVKEVSLVTDNKSKSTTYSYYNNALPSGVTSYEPGSYLPVNKQDIEYIKTRVNSFASDGLRQYAISYYESLPKLLSLARILPGPGVMYEYVTVNETIKRSGEAPLVAPQKSVYQFEVLKPNMVDILPISSSSSYYEDPIDRSKYDIKTREVAIHDFTTRIGRLKRRTLYTPRMVARADGSTYEADAKLHETVNHYLHDDLNNASLSDNITGYATRMNMFGNIGMIQETTGDARLVKRSDNTGYDRLVVMSGRKTYPVVLTGTTNTDFKTNTSVTTQNKSFDFVSGAVTSQLTVDSYGNRVLSESTPAYRKYPVMGPKLGGNGGRNMLTQSAGAASFKVDAQGNKQGLLQASAQTWTTGVSVLGTTPATPESRGTQSSIWRPQSIYSWLPQGATADGLTPLFGANAYTDFFTSGGTAPWKKTTEVTLYDVYSNALEARDINGKHLATKKGYEQSRVLMSGGPAAYNELVYTGLEDVVNANGTFKRSDGYISGGVSLAWPWWNWNSGDVTLVSGPNRPAGSTHTGNSSVRFRPNTHGLSYEVPIASVQPNKSYRLSVWASRPEGQLYYWVNGVERNVIGGTAFKQANGWYLVDLTIPPLGPGNTSLRVGCYNSSGTQDVYFDDFRFQPIDAKCAAYVYNENGKVTHILDNNNLYTRYEYDAAGRLTRTFRETFKYQAKLANEVTYQYGPIRPALDDVSLTVMPPTSNRSVQVVVNLPPALATNRTIHYSPQTGVAYATTSNPMFTVNYASAGTFWLRVLVTDSEGKQRELVSKLTVL